jgi:uncharacterized membrane protein
MSTETVPAPTRTAAIFIIAAIFILIGVLQAVTGATVANDMLADQHHYLMVVYMLGPLFATAGLHALTGVLVFLMRREAIAIMGALLGWSISHKFGSPFTPNTLFNAVLLALLTYFSIRLAMNGKLR